MPAKRYSDFLKIDLHIHTDKSRETKNGDYKSSFSVDVLHERLAEQEVQIFSLTDHNCINVQAYSKYYAEHCGPDDPLLLIGIEVDIEVSTERYHSLLVFCHHDQSHAESISQTLENHYSAKGQPLTERVLTLDEIVTMFPSDDFFFIPHAGSGSRSLVDVYRSDIPYAQRMLLLMPSCALEKVQQKAVAVYNAGFSQVMQQTFRHRDDIAYVQFSDNHNIEKYPCTHMGAPGEPDHSFYFVKGGKSYETLRQAFIDPKSRIKSTDEVTALSRPRTIIEGLCINNSSYVENCNLSFSPHLNVIIGGRSSGKSLLMSLFGRCIDRLPKSTIYDHLLENASIDIKTSQTLSYAPQVAIDTDPTWIGQGHIIRYFEEGKLLELAQKAGKEDERRAARQSLVEKCAEIKTAVYELLDAYENAHTLLNARSHVLHEKTIIDSLNTTFTTKFEHGELTEDLTEAKQNQQEALQKLQSALDATAVLKSCTHIGFDDSELDTVERFENLLKSKINKIKKSSAATQQRLVLIEKVGAILKETNDALGGSAQMKADAQLAISRIPADIKTYLITVKRLCHATKRVASINCKESESFIIEGDTSFVIEAISKDSPGDVLLDAIKGADTRLSPFRNILQLASFGKSVKNYGDNSPSSLRKKYEVLFVPIYDCYTQPVESLKYADGSTSKGNSPGFNSEKYLEIALSNAKGKLIFIDQPEDNLGNTFIAETLVEMLRDHKFSGQLFLVTHNPAIVVYGDAESIIIAENNDGTIKYEQLVLEDRAAQKRICGILDGGEYIFDQRAKKYNIQRILKELESINE